MNSALPIVQIVLSVLVILSILLQGRGAGLGASFGGGGEFYRSKRGVERILFRASLLLGVLFFLSSLVSIMFS